jgi:ribosomal protein S6
VGDEVKTYDAMFIFRETLTDDALEQSITGMHNEIARLQGAILAEARKGKASFVRPMRKNESGFYLRTVFQMDPAQVAPFKARLKLNEGLFRVQITLAMAAVAADPAAALVPPPRGEREETRNG